MWLIIVAYLIGSIPGGYLIGKLTKGIDVRNYGSKNAGATNVLRTLGKKEAAFTLFFDGLKGFLVIYIATTLNLAPHIVVLSGLAAIAGHNWPVFFGFRGGRGIATSIGIVVGLSWQVFFILLIIGVATIAITRYVSVGSILGAIVFPLLMLFYGYPLPYLLFAFLMTCMAIIRHVPNIKRLTQGKERKLGEKVEISERR